MIKLPDSIENSISYFSKLSGVGHKTATRQVMSMINWATSDLEGFSKALSSLTEVSYCKSCNIFSDLDECEICSNESRKTSGNLCVVESITDMIAIENSSQHNGVYYVLGGVLNPLMGIGPEQIKIQGLIDQVKNKNVENVILALSPSVEGDATCSYISEALGDINVERIGFGVPMGGSLEHLDHLTISKALENRRKL